MKLPEWGMDNVIHTWEAYNKQWEGGEGTKENSSLFSFLDDATCFE